MIHKLESAGLGYHVKTDESDDRLGMQSIFVTIIYVLGFCVTVVLRREYT